MKRTGSLAIFFACACSTPVPETTELPLSSARNVLIEIDYMPSAAPATAPLSTGADPWLLFQLNVASVLPSTVEGLAYPRTPGEMGRISAEPGRVFHADEILSLAKSHRDGPVAKDSAHFHVLFLDGRFGGGSPTGDEPTGDEPIAVSLEGTRVIAVFNSRGDRANDREKVFEQLALLHEFGHALGLVDLGVPDRTGHSDPSSPGHCTEASCVMGEVATFSAAVDEFIAGGTVPVVFGALCRRDLSEHYGQ